MLFILSLLLHVHSANAKANEQLSPIKIAEDNRLPTAPALIDALQSTLPSVRKEAAIAWGRIFKTESVSPLLTLINDPEPAVRDEALFSIGQLGAIQAVTAAREKEILTKLLEVLAQSSVHSKALGLEAYAKISLEDPSIILIPYFESEQRELRDASSRAVFEYAIAYRNRTADHHYPVFTDQLISKLIASTKDSSPDTRRNAVLVLSKAKAKVSLSALLGALQDSDLWVRYYALQGLGVLADAAAISEVLVQTQSTELSLRLEAVVALQKLNAGAQVSSSLALDPSAHVRTAVVKAWGAAPTFENSRFEIFANDPSPMVRAARIAVLATRLKGQARDQLIEQGLKDPSDFVRICAVDQLVTAADAETRLNALLSDSEVNVRAEAIAGYSDFTTESAHLTLVNLIVNSPDLSVRSNAYSVFASQEHPDFLAVSLDSYRSAKAAKWNNYRFDLLTAVSSIESADATAVIKEISSDSTPKIAFAAWAELMKRKIPDLPTMEEPLPPRSPFATNNFDKNPWLILTTSKGEMRIELFANDAQIHVAQVVGFAEKGGYSGLPWHRIVSDFVIQGGDPDRTGYGGSENPLRAEINQLRFERGTLGMPRNSDFDTGGVQLFITHVPTPNLDGLYTVFGQVREGLEVIDLIEPGDLILSARVIR